MANRRDPEAIERKRLYDANRRVEKRLELKAKRAAYYAANKERLRAKNAEWIAANPERHKALKAAWNKSHRVVTLAYYHRNKEKIARQKAGVRVDEPRASICAVCGNAGRIVLDHCHASRRFRGWLCSNCNSALGFAKDSPATLRALASYLEAA